MYNEKDVEDLAKKAQPRFDQILKDYQSRSASNDAALALFDQQDHDVRARLYQEILKIRQPDFHYRIVQETSAIEPKDTPRVDHCPFADFCYYIDQLNQMPSTKKIWKYNPAYGDRVIRMILAQYHLILGYLGYLRYQKEQANEKALQASKKEYLAAWEDFHSDLIPIIKQAANKRLQEIESSI